LLLGPHGAGGAEADRRRQHRPVLPGQAADGPLLLRAPVPRDGDADAHRAFRRQGAARHGRGPGMRRALILLGAALAASGAFAQVSPVGLWRSADDKTGEAKAEIRIVDNGGVLSGRIEKTLKKDAKPTCEECRDERKGQPIAGLEIIRGAKKAEGQDVWE